MNFPLFQPIQAEMKAMNNRYREILSCKDEKIGRYVDYVLEKLGKQIRPAIVFLSAAICGKITENTYQTALALEMLHASSLIHDDVVDEGTIRRNAPSVNAAFGNQKAVLIGDYLLSKCINMVVNAKDEKLLKTISDLAQAMTEGELLQLSNKEVNQLSKEVYFKMIERKTALLFAACFQLGARSAQISESETEKWQQIGLKFGLFFQICDDLSDFDSKVKTLKDSHKDIIEHKITLPLVLALQNCNQIEKKSLLNLYINHHGTEEEIAAIVEKVKEKGGTDATLQCIKEKKTEIDKFLNSFSTTQYQKCFLQLTDYMLKTVE